MLYSLDQKLHGRALEGWLRQIVLTQWGERPGPTVFCAIGTPALHPSITAPVRVNAGRWIVDCPLPDCGSAQLAHRTDRRYFCADCLNAAAGRLWIPTVWPGDALELEAALLLRPNHRTQNWTPPETLEAILKENAAHGVGRS